MRRKSSPKNWTNDRSTEDKRKLCPSDPKEQWQTSVKHDTLFTCVLGQTDTLLTLSEPIHNNSTCTINYNIKYTAPYKEKRSKKSAFKQNYITGTNEWMHNYNNYVQQEGLKTGDGNQQLTGFMFSFLYQTAFECQGWTSGIMYFLSNSTGKNNVTTSHSVNQLAHVWHTKCAGPWEETTRIGNKLVDNGETFVPQRDRDIDNVDDVAECHQRTVQKQREYVAFLMLIWYTHSSAIFV